MVIQFESRGSFTVGKPTLGALLSKRSRCIIKLTESNLIFQSERDKIIFEIKVSHVKDFYIKKRYNLSVIELEDTFGNYYSFYALEEKKENYFKPSKLLTEELFQHLTRVILKGNETIFFESKCTYLPEYPDKDWKTKQIQGIMLLTNNFLLFKPFEKQPVIEIKILDINKIKSQKLYNTNFLILKTYQKKYISITFFKKHLFIRTLDKFKLDKFEKLLEQMKIYKESEKLNLEKLEKERIEKLKTILEVSTRVKLDMMRSVLELDEKTFNDQVFEWAKKYNFIIDGDYLIVDPEKVSTFLDHIDLFPLFPRNKRKIKCNNCGRLVDSSATICPYCGEELQT